MFFKKLSEFGRSLILQLDEERKPYDLQEKLELAEKISRESVEDFQSKLPENENNKK